MKNTRHLLPGLAAALLAGAPLVTAQDTAPRPDGWSHSGVITLLTTPDGASLPAEAVVEGFPVLVRLDRDWFDFSQAKPGGEDLRVASESGADLPIQIENWDAAAGTATVWVRVPRITGNSRQALRLRWGNPAAASESKPAAVFNESNGFLSVWHMADDVVDDTGTLQTKDEGTTSSPGIIGTSRHLAGKQGLFGGDKIPNFPTGAAPHTTQAWFRAERANGTVIAWGNEQAQGKVVMQFHSPPHVRMDCYFSGANIESQGLMPMNEWIHVVHTWKEGESRIYVNGVLSNASTRAGAPLAIKSPCRLWIGGWYGNYDFIGDVDEVRLSRVTRSPEWVKLEYENQKAQQTLAGPLIQPGTEFSVSPAQASIPEGKAATFSAKAGGAQKVTWSLVRDGVETTVAVDRFSYSLNAGRVTGEAKATLKFTAVFPDGAKTKEIPVTITEDVPEPEFTLTAPAAWDGRTRIEITPQVTNLAAMQAKGAGEVKTEWTVGPFATRREISGGSLILHHAQNSGPLTITATMTNGGKPATRSVSIPVTEPAHDAWVARTPDADEKPEDGQFYGRDAAGEGTLFWNSTVPAGADSAFLRVFAGDQPYKTETAKPGAGGACSFSVRLKPGLVKYRTECGTVTGGKETILHKAENLVCGDAFLIDGQSNAVATDWGKDPPPDFHSEWIRSFGSTSGSEKGVHLWGEAAYRSRDADKLTIGYWAMELARRLVDEEKMPVCFINGAVGGTRIDTHQRSEANPVDMTTIYGRLLWRVREARLTHSIRAILWHQGENDQGADGPTGGYGWETYRQYFIDMAASWKRDYPNVQQCYVFQIWPKACSMGVDGSDNRLREVQRQLPTAFARMSLMSTLGIDPPGGCHYPPAGYVEIAKSIAPLMKRDFYGATFPAPITPPNLRRAFRPEGTQDEIVLEFDQPVAWDDGLREQFTLDGKKGLVLSGTRAGNKVTLRLAPATTAKTITYLDSKEWSQKLLLRGDNGIAALTFCEVPVLP